MCEKDLKTYREDEMNTRKKTHERKEKKERKGTDEAAVDH